MPGRYYRWDNQTRRMMGGAKVESEEKLAAKNAGSVKSEVTRHETHGKA